MTDFLAMPDFQDGLEQKLRQRSLSMNARRPAVSPRRAAAAGTGVVALAIATILTLSVIDRDSGSAYGRPLALDGPTVDATTKLAQTRALGDDLRLDQAHEVPAFGTTAYLVQGDDRWCLIAPALASTVKAASADTVVCTSTAEIDRVGISLVVGDRLVAAVPEGAPAPTVGSATHPARELRPDNHGIVTTSDLKPGEVATLYAADGANLNSRVVSVDPKTGEILGSRAVAIDPKTGEILGRQTTGAAAARPLPADQ
ncbi:MAG TPA: hypothetical protein VNT22_05925 [Baekduia sp.]|nr:hypothetical protein [Baekduia sp.]